MMASEKTTEHVYEAVGSVTMCFWPEVVRNCRIKKSTMLFDPFDLRKSPYISELAKKTRLTNLSKTNHLSSDLGPLRPGASTHKQHSKQ